MMNNLEVSKSFFFYKQKKEQQIYRATSFVVVVLFSMTKMYEMNNKK